MGECEKQVPKELLSTVQLLRKAYPDGIPDRDYFAVLALLGPHMSERGLGEAVSYCCEHDRFVIGNDWAAVASRNPPPAAELERVRSTLEAAGFSEWLTEDE
jgi:hypothetical protein